MPEQTADFGGRGAEDVPNGCQHLGAHRGDDGFEDLYVLVGTTFGGVGVIRGDLTPECATAVRAVLEALGKKAGQEATASRVNAYTTPSY